MNVYLQATLATVIQQLADFFGMTTEVVMQNAPIWLAKYGWFTMAQNLPFVLLVAFLLSGAITMCHAFITEFEDAQQTIKVGIISTIFSVILCVGILIIQCATSPEFYGLKAIIETISK